MKKPKNKMSLEHRAKQFMPFSPLKGYEEALRIKEEEVADFYDYSQITHEFNQEIGEDFKNE